MFKSIAAACAVISLSACGGTLLGGATQVVIPKPPPAPAGIIPTNVTPAGLSGGYSYGTGTVTTGSGSIGRGYAQLLPFSFSAPPVSGSAVLNGTYAVESVPVLAGGALGISTAAINQPLTLTADFQNRTLTGNDGNLFVNGAITNGQVAGTVTYQGIPTNQVSAIVTANRAIGAFVGTSTNRLYAGGFDVSN